MRTSAPVERFFKLLILYSNSNGLYGPLPAFWAGFRGRSDRWGKRRLPFLKLLILRTFPILETPFPTFSIGILEKFVQDPRLRLAPGCRAKGSDN